MEQPITENRKFFAPELKKVVLWSLLIKVVLFCIVIFSIDPFIITDDRAYEEISKTYLLYAQSLWDWNAIYATGGDGYLQVFWPYTICFFAKLLGTEYAGRILNIILSTLCIYVVYNLAQRITNNEDKSYLAAKLMAFLPYPLLFCVFNIKDFYIMFGVFYTFSLFVKWQNNEPVKIFEIILSVLLLFGVYFARGGVVEFVGLAFAFFIANRFIKNRQFGYLGLLVVAAILAFLQLSDSILGAFDAKLDDYGNVGLQANGLRMVQMHTFREIYKLPLQYVFSIVMPFTNNYFAVTNEFTWLGLLTTLNVTMYPISFGCFFYLFMKKHNSVFFWSTFFVYIIITALVLAIFRHYFFLFPLHVLTFVCFWDRASDTQKKIVWTLSCALVALILVLSLPSI